MDCLKEALIFTVICLAIILCLFTNAKADYNQMYFVPKAEITSEQVLGDILSAIVKDFSKNCPGEKELKVFPTDDGIYFQIVCICEEV